MVAKPAIRNVPREFQWFLLIGSAVDPDKRSRSSARGRTGCEGGASSLGGCPLLTCQRYPIFSGCVLSSCAAWSSFKTTTPISLQLLPLPSGPSPRPRWTLRRLICGGDGARLSRCFSFGSSSWWVMINEQGSAARVVRVTRIKLRKQLRFTLNLHLSRNEHIGPRTSCQRGNACSMGVVPHGPCVSKAAYHASLT